MADCEKNALQRDLEHATRRCEQLQTGTTPGEEPGVYGNNGPDSDRPKPCLYCACSAEGVVRRSPTCANTDVKHNVASTYFRVLSVDRAIGRVYFVYCCAAGASFHCCGRFLPLMHRRAGRFRSVVSRRRRRRSSHQKPDAVHCLVSDGYCRRHYSYHRRGQGQDHATEPVGGEP